MESTARLSELIFKFLADELSPDEHRELEDWRAQQPENEQLFQELISPEHFREGIRSVYAAQEAKARTYERVLKALPQHKIVKTGTRRLHRYWPAAAAIVFLVCCTGAYLWFSAARPEQPVTAGHIAAHTTAQQDVHPGGNKAVLTLSNGTTVLLDSARNGVLASEGSSKITKVGSGLLAYTSQHSGNAGRQQQEVEYNTLTTPRGGQYQLMLPDGTKVWLNAASSIRYPTVFAGRERKVQVTGECYFEVAGNAAMPFIVETNKIEVDVLGTHFNIMAYNDEITTTTSLLQGSVKIVKGNTALLLQPGQEAQVDENGKMELVTDANMNEAIAWKDNLFWFENDDIQTVMRQLSRWYNVDIVIRGNIPDRFTGSIPRNITFSKVFEVLQKTGSIHFSIENEKVIVSS